MKPNVLLLNVHSARNAGDAALTQAAIDQLCEHFPDCRITLMMNDPDSHNGAEIRVLSFLAWIEQAQKRQSGRFARLLAAGVTAVFSYRLSHAHPITGLFPQAMRPTIEALLAADLVVSTPGGYFFSYGRGKALIVLITTMALAVLAGKPLYVFPQSIGPFKFARERRLAAWVLKRARVVMARESESIRNLEALGLAKGCYLLPDMAFAFEGDPPEAARSWLLAQGFDPQVQRPRLGLTVIDWAAQYPGFNRQNNYEDAVVAGVRHFVERYQGIAIFYPQSTGPSTMEDDRLPARCIAARLADLSDSILVVEEPLSPQLLKALFGEMDLFVGTRMHSNIFALGMCTPVVAIGYLHKTRGIARTVGIEDWVLDIQTVDGAALIERLDRLWEQRQSVRLHLEETLPRLAREARQAGIILAENYNKLTDGN